MRKVLLMLLMLILSSGIVFAEDWTRIEKSDGSNNGVAIADWNGQSSYAVGWSKWSTTKPTNAGQYAVTYVYISPSGWSGESCGGQQSEKKIAATPDEKVVKNNRNYNTYKDDYTYSYCPGYAPSGSGRAGYYGCDYSKCALTGAATGWCTNGSVFWCEQNSMLCSDPKAAKRGYTTRCRKLNCPEDQYATGCTGNETWGNQGCGVYATYYCYQTATGYPTPTAEYSTSTNWKTSLANAGSYALQVKIYSYPERVFIKYDGNGANGTCNLRNDINNPDPTICSEYGASVMNDSYISYYDNEPGGIYQLSQNKYYRIGYDFLGWALTPNATLPVFNDLENVWIAKAGASHPKEITAFAGDTVTLYAVWKKHDYKITYDYYCGKSDLLENIYHFEEGIVLEPLDVSDGAHDTNHLACDTNEKNGAQEQDSNTTFEGWYLDPDYINRVDELPNSYHTDLTLYAKLSQRRVYNYTDNNWKYE